MDSVMFDTGLDWLDCGLHCYVWSFNPCVDVFVAYYTL